MRTQFFGLASHSLSQFQEEIPTEITSPFYAGGVPETATEVGEERKFRP